MSSHNQFRLVKNEEKCEKNPLLKRNSVLSVPTFTYSKLSCRWRKWCLMNSSWHWSLGKKPVPHLLYVMLPLYLAFLSIFAKTIFPGSLPPGWILTFSIAFSKCDLNNGLYTWAFWSLTYFCEAVFVHWADALFPIEEAISPGWVWRL